MPLTFDHHQRNLPKIMIKYKCAITNCSKDVRATIDLYIGDIRHFFCSSKCRNDFRQVRTAGAAERVAAFLEKKRNAIIGNPKRK